MAGTGERNNAKEGLTEAMKSSLTFLLAVIVVGIAVMTTAPTGARVLAQNRMTYPIVSQNSGHVALGLAIRKLGVAGAFMQAPAHPDDETNALFAMFAHGMGLRSIDLQNNRGDGGQNEIGPELFRDIAVLRTAELLAAHRIDGAEQYFTRAIDYGYSFDPQEVIQKWGREEIVGDYVRLIRTLRPDVVLTMNIQGRGGDRAHEATTILFREAYYAAGDPSKYPAHLREGLRPWQPKKLYFSAPPLPAGAAVRPAAIRLTPANTNTYDSLLGRTYAEIGTDARSNHKCQGMSGLPALPGFGNAGRGGGRAGRGGGGPGGLYQLIDSTIPGQKDRPEISLFDGVDTRLEALARYAGPKPPAALISAIDSIAADARLARKAFDSGNDGATAPPIEAGLAAIRGLRAQLASPAALGLDDSARYEIDFRLRLKERDYQDAVLAAHGLSFDAVADDGLVIAGEPVKLSILAVNRGSSDISVTGVTIAGFDGPSGCAPGAIGKDAVYTCAATAHVPKSARPTTPYFNDNYWKHPENPAIQIFDPDVEFGVPFAPTPFRVTFHVKAGEAEITREVPVEFRYVKDLYLGDKRTELNVVPRFSVSVTPALAVFPAGSGASAKREIHVTVINSAKGAVEASVSLDLPAGWKTAPARVPLSFAHEDEALSARFELTAPQPAQTGQYKLRAIVTSPAIPDEKFSDGYEVIEYPHIQRRQAIKPAEAALKVVDVKVTQDIDVGYISGVGDQVPAALEQLGAKLSYIEQDELAWGDLSRHDVIMTGVRAYERRTDLRAYNRRLLDYVSRGGTVIVQYNKMEFNQADYGPYPAKVSGNRVSDELVPVKLREPAHPVFNFPNTLGTAAWAGWVQERGLYFLGEKDPKYVDLVSMTDSFKDNPGEKLGAMVEARYGRGNWIYLGLGLWRQLPAGTDGAYQLLANLISLPKAKPALR
jgi:LmbE family N-acetylglucosaminyl deacetylase